MNRVYRFGVLPVVFFRCSFGALAGLLLSASPVHAVALLLNFTGESNPVTNVDPDFDAQVSAAHSAAAVPLSEVSWNNLQTGDVAEGDLVWSDGSLAGDISLNLGVSASGVDTIDYANNPTNVGLGSMDTGIFSGTRVARYGIWGGGSSGSDIAAGLRIDGLGAGIYDIYFVARNTANSGSLSSIMYATAGTGDTYDYSLETNFSNVANDTSGSNSDSYAEGVNYGKLTVTLAEGQSLYLATEGTTTFETRGFLNSVEVVLVPEPSSALLLGLGLTTLLAARRRGRMR